MEFSILPVYAPVNRIRNSRSREIGLFNEGRLCFLAHFLIGFEYHFSIT
jgi:hypothetical protein